MIVIALSALFIFIFVLLSKTRGAASLRVSNGGFLSIFFYYTLISSTLLGSILIYIGLIGSDRFYSINEDVKFNVLFHVFFSILSIYFIIYFFSLIISKEQMYASQINIRKISSEFENNKSKILFFLNSTLTILYIYVFLKYFLFFSNSPIYFLIQGDLVSAAIMRMEIQTHAIAVDIPFLSKVVYLFCFIMPVYTYVLYVAKKVSLKLFVSSIFVSFLYLIFDLSKAPFLYIVLMILFIRISVKGYGFGLAVSIFAFLITIIVMYYFIMGGVFEPVDLFLRIFDRVAAGQNQGMYYMFQYFEPSTVGVYSDLPLSNSLGIREVKPDERIVEYIYSNSEHIVNSNTYFLGEAWAFFGLYGLWISPFVVGLNLCFYLYVFTFLSKRSVIYWVLGFVFFSTLPINQSLQFIVYQKYFLYFVFFAIIPVYFVRLIAKAIDRS